MLFLFSTASYSLTAWVLSKLPEITGIRTLAAIFLSSACKEMNGHLFLMFIHSVGYRESSKQVKITVTYLDPLPTSLQYHVQESQCPRFILYWTLLKLLLINFSSMFICIVCKGYSIKQ